MNFLEYILNKEEELDSVNKIGKIPLPDDLEDAESPRKDQSSSLIDIDVVLSLMNSFIFSWIRKKVLTSVITNQYKSLMW